MLMFFFVFSIFLFLLPTASAPFPHFGKTRFPLGSMGRHENIVVAPERTAKDIDRSFLKAKHVADSWPYFYLMQGQTRCFEEELNPHSLVHVLYKCEQMNQEKRLAAFRLALGTSAVPPQDASPVGLEVSITSPAGKISLEVLTREQDTSAFVNDDNAGEYTICLQSNFTAWYGEEKFKLHLQIDSGFDEPNVNELTSKSSVDILHNKVNGLKHMMAEIKYDQLAYRVRNARFRDTVESTFTRVWGFALTQILVLIATALWQLYSLRNFLRQKKLV